MTSSYSYRGSIAYIKGKLKALYPKSEGYNELADVIYNAVKPENEQNSRDKNNFRTTVKRWFMEESKSLPTTPEYLMALASALHTSVDAIFAGADLPNDSHLSFYSVAKSDNPVYYDQLKTQLSNPGNLFEEFDEFGKRFFDYLCEDRSYALIKHAFTVGDLKPGWNFLLPLGLGNLGKALPIFLKKFDEPLFDHLYDRDLVWFDGVVPPYHDWKSVILVDSSVVSALLHNPAFISKVTTIYSQDHGQRIRKLYGTPLDSHPAYNQVRYLHGGYNLAFEEAIKTKDLSLIRPFLLAGKTLNEEILQVLQGQKALVNEMGEASLGEFAVDAYYFQSVVSYPRNLNDLKALEEQEPLIKEYLATTTSFTRQEVQ